MEHIYSHGNPYQEPPEQRLSWNNEKTLKLLPKDPAETLFYVGCTTSYEPELQNVARSLVTILTQGGVDFGVLAEEKCCADPVDKIGDQFLYQELANGNEEAFLTYGCSRMVTVSPHCYHTFIHSYPNLKDKLEILHYTQFIDRLIATGALSFGEAKSTRVTYNDPCYLSKHHDILKPPRAILQSLPGVDFVEMEQYGKESLCCGGGGGRMFHEVECTNWLGETRVQQALAVKAEIIATACPWCHTILDNAVKNLGLIGQLQVLDIAEIVASRLTINQERIS